MLPLAVLLSACGDRAEDTPPAAPVAAATTATTGDAAAPALPAGFARGTFAGIEGRFRLVSLDDAAPPDDFGESSVRFTQTTLSWDGCNHHEGLYIATGDSLAVLRGPSTLVNCPPDGPDNALSAILTARPAIGRDGDGRIAIAGGGHRAILVPDGPARDSFPAPAIEGREFALMLSSPDGSPVLLRVAEGRLSVDIGCPDAISGRVDGQAGTLVLRDVESRACPGTAAPSEAQRRLLRVLSADPAYVVGPNGDLLLAAGETVVAGRAR
ncbi:hypothetical protein [Croceicoccus sp. YJ47]|uniref:hypothetical protein n=1 Tax=Croceicoccus sp. YJ47 TaxID=2798724 RepID=UPI001920623E|nr:hypothetical protein [Croceicoccus sp. YJ47]QQN74506.1 hypothetical protein JD971_01585 [Croceicoccus sp. YJ47]